MATPTRLRAVLRDSANVKAVRGLMIGLAALVVLVVSGFGTVVYIDLMGKVFPSGPQVIACYLGAGANFLLMLVLLIGKFTWFRPGAQEVASWIVTGVEVLVCILNLILAFQMGGGQPTGFMAVWLNFAPISPVFSMVGATALIMTSVELRKRHRDLELQEQKEQSERELDLAFHEAEIEVKGQYLTIIKDKLTQELNAPERHQEIAAHARAMVSQVLSGLTGMQSLPSVPSVVALPPSVAADSSRLSPESGQLDAGWLQEANRRIEQERQERLARQAEDAEDAEGQGLEQQQAFVRRVLLVLAQDQERLTDLHRVEQMLGYGQAWKLPLDVRVKRVVRVALEMGYGLEEMMAFLGWASPVESSEDDEVQEQGGEQGEAGSDGGPSSVVYRARRPGSV